MVGGIVVMLFMTWGLSRLAMYFLPSDLDERTRAMWANIGALVVIGAIYVAITVSEQHGSPALIFLGLAFAAPCQVVWYYRDIRKIANHDRDYPRISAARSPAPASVPDITPQRTTTSLSAAASRPPQQTPVPPAGKPEQQERWLALSRFDTEIEAAARQLRPFGEKWVDELGRAFFALNEDKAYLPNIISRLTEEAAAERDAAVAREEAEGAAAASARAANWERNIERVMGGKLPSSALDVLREAENAGYVVETKGGSISVTKNGTTWLYGEADIERFGRILRARLRGGSTT
jgi:hypothetical protein